MRVSAKIDYACRALTELALHWPDKKPLQIQIIAKRQKIPIKFLVHILIQLKQMGFAESVRGKNGGYILNLSPADIKLSSIIKSFGGLGFTPAEIKKKQAGKQVMDIIWQEIDQSVIQMMDKINFENICNLTRSNDKSIIYEI